jgi:hypothetical protein
VRATAAVILLAKFMCDAFPVDALLHRNEEAGRLFPFDVEWMMDGNRRAITAASGSASRANALR